MGIKPFLLKSLRWILRSEMVLSHMVQIFILASYAAHLSAEDWLNSGCHQQYWSISELLPAISRPVFEFVSVTEHQTHLV